MIPLTSESLLPNWTSQMKTPRQGDKLKWIDQQLLPEKLSIAISVYGHAPTPVMSTGEVLGTQLQSELEKCLELANGVFRAGHFVSDRRIRSEDLVIVAAGVALVTKEMDLLPGVLCDEGSAETRTRKQER